jgi:F0F1-type ATP synthase membrane subunit a
MTILMLVAYFCAVKLGTNPIVVTYVFGIFCFTIVSRFNYLGSDIAVAVGVVSVIVAEANTALERCTLLFSLLVFVLFYFITVKKKGKVVFWQYVAVYFIQLMVIVTPILLYLYVDR